MNRDCHIEAYRCLCMLGIVGIHAFTWCHNLTRVGWLLCCPALVGFVMISGWFGIHFKWIKILRILGTVGYCVVVSEILRGGIGIDAVVRQFKGYWYVWAYIFVMMFAPIVDEFVQKCANRRTLITAFLTMATLLWGWAFLSAVPPTMKYLPSVAGFGSGSGVVLLCVYILIRIIKELGWINLLDRNLWRPIILLSITAMFVVAGFRHTSSVFAFGYALSILLIVKRIPINERICRIICWLGPSTFSVYLLHMPFYSDFPLWEQQISEMVRAPHWVSQIVLMICVFIAAIVIDAPRRIILYFFDNYVHRHKLICLDDNSRASGQDQVTHGGAGGGDFNK